VLLGNAKQENKSKTTFVYSMSICLILKNKLSKYININKSKSFVSPESADLVDVIHTDGALEPAVVWVNPHSGDLHQLGHVDFYPSGGAEQPGCGLGRFQIKRGGGGFAS
jgi:hypothetical protein